MESVKDVSLRNVPRSPALSTTILESYIEAKKTFKQVKPTCGVESCLKNTRMRSIHQRARRANHTWKNEKRMTKRLRILKSREDAAQAVAVRRNDSEDTISDEKDSDMDLE